MGAMHRHSEHRADSMHDCIAEEAGQLLLALSSIQCRQVMQASIRTESRRVLANGNRGGWEASHVAVAKIPIVLYVKARVCVVPALVSCCHFQCVANG